MNQSPMWTGTHPLFTAAQWKELEHQAHIFKYIKAGLPVPPELLAPIQNSFQLMSPKLVLHPTLGYGSYYGKKIDPEPGRCRRTDGKKWRCSKDAYPDSKYCERHMNRRKYRSRKLVEAQTDSQSLSNPSSDNAIGIRGSCGSLPSLPLNSTGSGETLSLGSNISQLQMGPFSGSIAKKGYSSTIDTVQNYRCDQKLETDKHFVLEGFENSRFKQNPEVDWHNFFQDDLVNARHNCLLGTSESTWPDTSDVSSNSLEGSRNVSFMAGNSFQFQTIHDVEPSKANASASRQTVFDGELVIARPTQPTQNLFGDWHKKQDLGSSAINLGYNW